MRRYCGLVSVCAMFLLVVCLPALAGPVNGFSGATLSGISAPSASGFSSTEFSHAPVSFGGNWMFAGVRVTNRHVSGYSISEGSFSGGSFSEDSDGGFSRKDRRHGGCGERKDCHSIPEGGAEVTYLMLSGIAVFAGILISGKQRRATRAVQSN
jgi:hypothetical protein